MLILYSQYSLVMDQFKVVVLFVFLFFLFDYNFLVYSKIEKKNQLFVYGPYG